MLRKIFSIAFKEFRLWIQTPGNWLTVFLVPILFISILGSVFSGGTPVVTVFAVNADKGERGAEIIDLLAKSENLEFETLTSQTEADLKVGKGERMAAVVIPENFSEAVLTDDGGQIMIIVDPARAKDAGIVTGLVQSALIKSIVYAEIDRALQGLFKDTKTVKGASQDDFKLFINAGIRAVVAKSVNDAVDKPLIKIEPEPLARASTQTKISMMSSLSPGFALMFAFFLISHLADTVMNERTTGTLRRLMTTPVTRAQILFGKALPFFLIAVFQLAFVLALCNMAFKVPLGNNPIALTVILLATGLAVAGMGILIAALVKNETQAGVVATLAVLIMAAVSGCLMPQVKVAGLNLVTPHYWALEGIQNVIARGMGMEGVLMQSGILLGMAVLFFAIGAWRFKFE
jgi:ABC-2 type transport system permease protein